MAQACEALASTGIWSTVAVPPSGVVYPIFENHVGGLGLCAPGLDPGGTDAMVL